MGEVIELREVRIARVYRELAEARSVVEKAERLRLVRLDSRWLAEWKLRVARLAAELALLARLETIGPLLRQSSSAHPT